MANETRKFETELVLDLSVGKLDEESGITLVRETEGDRKRWSHFRGYVVHDRSDNTYWHHEFEFPNTEEQDVGDRGEWTEFTRVYPKQKTVVVTTYEVEP